MPQKPSVFFAPVHATTARLQPLNVEVIVFTLTCGHRITKSRSAYADWQNGDPLPVPRLKCPYHKGQQVA